MNNITFDAKEKRRLLQQGFSVDEIIQLEIQRDPSLWAETYLTDPEQPRKPLRLRSYQRDMISCQDKKKVYRLGRRCVAEDCKILLSNGIWKQIKDISLGDIVVSYDKYKLKNGLVINKWDNGIRDVFKIILNNGQSIEITSDHKMLSRIKTDEKYLLTKSGFHNKPVYRNKVRTLWYTIDEGLQVGDSICVVREYNTFGTINDETTANQVNNKKHLKKQRSSSKTIKWEKILSITHVGQKRVFDIEVKDYHNFICNGMVTHNCGKSIALAVEALWLCFVQEGVRILICTPFKQQTANLWKDGFNKLIKGNELLESSISKSLQNPYLIEFKNGSRILGLTAGSSTGNKGASIRGQCLDGESSILMDCGISKPISLVKIGDIVQTLDLDNFKITKNFVKNVYLNNIKDLYKYTTSSGREIICSKDHKILTKDGWNSAGSLKINDKLVLRNAGIFGTLDLTYEEVSILAYLLGDGSCGEKTIHDNCVKFINNNPSILTDYKEICNKFQLTFREYVRNNVTEITISDLKNSAIFNILKKHNILCKLSYDKEPSDLIMQLNKEKQSLFIRKLFSTDGWCCSTNINGYDQVEIGYCSTSKNMSKKVQSILSNFGIVSKMQKRDKYLDSKKCLTQYIVKISSRYQIKLFFNNIGFIFGKEEQCSKVFDIVKNYNQSKDFHNFKEDIYYDKLIEISFYKRKKTYDIEIENTHNFFVDDLVVHNSADILILDEVDYMGEEAIQTIQAIAATTRRTRMIISSTPTGKREYFYQCCTNKSLGFKEFHYTAAMSPEWLSIADARRKNLPLHESQEYLYRNTVDESKYRREYDAEFGEESQGVFKHKYIDSSLVSYDPAFEESDPKGMKWYCGDEQLPGNIYAMGVDWNGTKVGTQIVITEYCRVPTDIRSVVDNIEGGTTSSKMTVSKKYRVFYRESVSLEDMTQLESISRIIELTQKFKIDHIYVDAGFGTCVAPNTLITTLNGVKEIQYIHRDDKVLTEDGSYQQVLNKIVKKCDDNYIIQPSKCMSVTVSYCHPFYVYSSINRFKDNNISEKDLVWKDVRNINYKKDFLAIPKSQYRFNDEKEEIVDIVKILSTNNIRFNKTHVWLPNSFDVKNRTYNSKKELAKLLNTSIATIQRIKRSLINNCKLTNKQSKLYKDNKDLFSIKPSIIKLPRYINIISDDFQRIAGWFISEGTINYNNIEISQESTRYNKEINKLKISLQNCFGSYISEYTKINKYNNTVRQIVFSGKLISLLFENLFGKYSENKRIPFEMMKHPKQLGLFIKCCLMGDSNTNQKTSDIQISRTSASLIYQLRQIFIDNNILPSIYNLRPRKTNYKEQFLLKINGNTEIINKVNNFININITNNKRIERKKYIELDNYFLVPIKKIKQDNKSIDLVDIQVENVHSFCGNGILLHNTNIEELRLYGKRNPESEMNSKLVAIDFASKVTIYDPFSKEEVDKAMKPFSVNNAALALERNELLLPDSEDEKVKLVGQMREYRIEKISPTGTPRYTEDNDHILDAFMLSLLAFQMEYSELIKLTHTNTVAVSKNPLMLIPGMAKVQDRNTSIVKDKFEQMGIGKRQPALGAESYHSDSRGNHMDYSELMGGGETNKTTSPFTNFNSGPTKTGWSRSNAPTRSNF